MASKSSPSRQKAGTSPPTSEGVEAVSNGVEAVSNGVEAVSNGVEAVSNGVEDAGRIFEPAPHYLDHRQRLRTRFLEGGAGAMPDYEIMELVLFAAIPRRDVKPLAKKLISHFGNFAEAIAAPIDRLMEIDGVGESVATHLKIVEAAALRLSRTQVLNKPAMNSWAALIDYCTAAMARNPYEEFRILFLDRKNVLIADEVQSKGTIDHTPVYPREIVKRALEVGAAAIILVHNHPTYVHSITLNHARTH